jgi:hypothetical protein
MSCTDKAYAFRQIQKKAIYQQREFTIMRVVELKKDQSVIE